MTPRAKAALLLVLLTGGVLLAINFVLEGPRRRGKANLAALRPVTQALSRYRQDCGTYPRRLAELVPNWIARIPSLRGGGALVYRQDGGDRFRLFSDGEGRSEWYIDYDSERGDFYIDSK